MMRVRSVFTLTFLGRVGTRPVAYSSDRSCASVNRHKKRYVPDTNSTHALIRSGSSPIHPGWDAVASYTELVLNGSYSPSLAGPFDFASSCSTSASVIGLKVRMTSSACSRTDRESHPVITTDVGRCNA